MEDVDALIADANENLRSAFAMLASNTDSGESKQYGMVGTATADVPAPIFNRAFAFEQPAIDELAEAVSWLRERDVPFWVTVTEPAVDVVENNRTELDLQKVTEQPGMVKTQMKGHPPQNPAVEIVEVTDENAREEFSKVTAAAFDWSDEVVEPVDRAAVTADDIRPFLGRVDGEPAASGLLIRSGDVAGVYSIAVVEECRRQGLGEAMTRQVLHAGREAGCRMAVLQSSEMGYPLYEQLGFKTFVTYHHFAPAD